MDVIFFETLSDLRAWFVEHHDQAQELWIGFYKKSAGKTGVTYAEAVDEALCFGWIDGIRKRVDDTSYTNRFTPRKARSHWSAVNIRRVGELTALERMHESGWKAFEERDHRRSQQYSFEQENPGLSAAYETRFQEHEDAWKFFQSQPPSYQRTASWWVMSAKREETRLKRLAILIDDSANQQRIALLRR